MPYTYLASPYSHTDPAVMEERYERAKHAVKYLMAIGEVVYSPIVHNHFLAKDHDLPRGFEFWRKFDFAMLERAEKFTILRIDGWSESKGVAEELAEAHRLGIRVEYL